MWIYTIPLPWAMRNLKCFLAWFTLLHKREDRYISVFLPVYNVKYTYSSYKRIQFHFVCVIFIWKSQMSPDNNKIKNNSCYFLLNVIYSDIQKPYSLLGASRETTKTAHLKSRFFSIQVCITFNMTARFFHSANKSSIQKRNKTNYDLSLWFQLRIVNTSKDIPPKMSVLCVIAPLTIERKFQVNYNVANGQKDIPQVF